MSVALALMFALLIPARANAFATFSNGVLTITASEGKIVPRCAADGEITVSGLSVEDGPAYCRDLRRIEASSIVAGLFDFSQLPDNLGGGQGPIEIHAFSKVSDPTEIADDKFIGAPGHVNIFDGGLGFDSITGGNLNDTLSGGADSDKIEGGGGSDTLLGGSAADKLLGGPGRDVLKGGSGNDKLIGGPGKDVEKQ
ncbi:MAG TPA: calcium-binding protein [Solirubrobacterales bacterium]|nr:calcium-binding protein [Solirubrobacterales bacterium]